MNKLLGLVLVAGALYLANKPKLDTNGQVINTPKKQSGGYISAYAPDAQPITSANIPPVNTGNGNVNTGSGNTSGGSAGGGGLFLVPVYHPPVQTCQNTFVHTGGGNWQLQQICDSDGGIHYPNIN